MSMFMDADVYKRQMSYLLKEVVNAGTATKAKVLGRPVAGKTGTSNDWKDAWFIGFTPHLVTGMYVGYDPVSYTHLYPHSGRRSEGL